MELYKTRVGSHYYGINIDSSDIDTWIVDSDVKERQSIINGKDHTYRISPGEAIAQFSGFIPIPFFVSALFPKNPNGEVAQFLIENNEEIIEANKKFLFEQVKTFSQKYPLNQKLSINVINSYPKKVAYRLLTLNMFIKYANSNNFSESIILTEEEKKLFKEIRLNQIPHQQILDMNEDLYYKLLKNKQFFYNENLDYLRNNVKTLEQIMGVSHEDFIKQISSLDKYYKEIMPDVKKLY